MNLRQFTMAMLISALPVGASAAQASLTLNAGDFVASKRVTPEGEVRVKLSKSGKAKLRKLKKEISV